MLNNLCYNTNMNLEKKTIIFNKSEKDPEDGREHIKWYERMQNFTIGQSPETKQAIEKIIEKISQLENKDKEEMLNRLEETLKKEEAKNEGSLEEIVEKINQELGLQNLQ